MEWKMLLEMFAVVGGIATVFVFILAPMFWLGAKLDAFRQEVHDDMNEFRKEMKIFHGRLCAIEERNKK